MKDGVEFVYGFDLVEEYLELIGLSFPPEALERKRHTWDWLYNNPFNTGEHRNTISVLARNDEIRGMIFLLAAEYVIAGTPVPGLMPMTANVRPKDRGAGVSLLKSLFKIGHGGVTISLSNSQGMVTFFERHGGLKAERNLRRRFYRPGTFVAKARKLPGALGRVADVIALVQEPYVALRRPRPGRGETLERIDAFGPDFDTAWERARPNVAFAHTRNAAFLQWRYMNHPLQSYDGFVLRRGGAVAGFVVTSMTEDPRGRCGRVVDVFVYEGKTDAERVRDCALLLAQADRHFRKNGCVFAEIAYTAGDMIDPAARMNGYSFHKKTRAVTFDVEDPKMRLKAVENATKLHYMRGDSDEDY